MQRYVGILCVAAALTGCKGDKKKHTDDDHGPGGGGVYACGNGALNGLEACDGTLFAASSTCAGLGLGDGMLGCSSTCTLDLSACASPDYCDANGLYDDGACDACDLLGGHADADCATACASDAACGDVFDPLTGVYPCVHAGSADPDCGTCGNGVVEGSELCDGTSFAVDQDGCDDYGFPGGTLACADGCVPRFTSCVLELCGNGIVEGSEECDGAANSTCTEQGFTGGALACTSCRYDTGDCTSVPAADPTSYIDAVCGYMARCATQDGRLIADAASCKSEFAARAVCDPVLAPQQALDSCAASIQVAACNGAGTVAFLTPGCVDLLLGDRVAHQGEACGADVFCLDDTYCSVSGADSCGVCVARPQEGGTCDTSFAGPYVPCAAGLICSGTTCVPAQGEGDPCDGGSDCLSGICKDDFCAEPIAEGEPCDENDSCAGNLECSKADAASPSTCRQRGLANAYCEQDDHCIITLFCVDNACAPLSACEPREVGQGCDDTEECGSGHYCNYAGVCAALVPLDGECDEPEACGPGNYCDFVDGCQPRQGIGGTCFSSTTCQDGLTCNFTDDVCVARYANGASCTSDGQCASGFCANDDTCTDPVSCR